MYGLKERLEKEEQKLSRINDIVTDRLKDIPEGSLIVTSSRGSKVFRVRTIDEKGKRHVRYIKKDNDELIRALAQKEYDEKLKRLVDRRLKQTRKINEEYLEDEIDSVYNNLNQTKRQMVSPAWPTWEQRVYKWKNTPYEGKEFEEGAPLIYTKKGERVRSKSEKILADTFNDLGIEYKYECPIKLKGYGVVYPDFTFMSKYSDGLFYWEHCGKMDDPKYVLKMVRKIDNYVRNGIFPGERLIITYETSNYTLNDKVVQELINKYLL